MADDLEKRLGAKVLTIKEPCVALELQWEIVEDDARGGYLEWVLELHVIVEQAGWEHSRYTTRRLHTFPAESLDQRSEAHRTAQAVARLSQLPLQAPPVQDKGGQGGSNWLRQVPRGSPVPYQVNWEATWWTEEGLPQTGQGMESVRAESGKVACDVLSEELRVRLGGSPKAETGTSATDRPLLLRTSTLEATTSWTQFRGDYPANSLPVETVRAIAREESCSPSRICQALLSHEPTLSALSLMKIFASSFCLPLEALTPLARRRAGEIQDAALEATLASEIESQRRRWDRPRVLREAARSDESVAAIIRREKQQDQGMIHLIMDVREAFGLGLSEAKMFVESCGIKDDASLDRLLEQSRTRSDR